MTIDELLIDFDEMGFVPTTLCENPDEYARDWEKQLLVEIKRLKAEYEAERKMLGSQIKVLKQRLNDKYIEIDNLNRDYSNAFERLKSQQQEINALKEKCEELRNKMWDAQDDLDCYYDEMPTRINQAVQDFAEKLKEKARGLTLEGDKGAGFYIGNILLTNDIDELLKEYE